MNTNTVKKPTEPFNFNISLVPLLNAMFEGKTIASVTCYCGTENKDNPKEDFTITDFIAHNYRIATASNDDKTEHYDYVDTDRHPINKDGARGFYMHWVKSFELYEAKKYGL
jgi:hypothetical protein